MSATHKACQMHKRFHTGDVGISMPQDICYEENLGTGSVLLGRAFWYAAATILDGMTGVGKSVITN